MRPSRRLLAPLLVAVALAACGGGNHNGKASGVRVLPSSSCAKVEYGGSGKPNALIASDLPMRGSSGERSRQMVEAIRLVLDGAGWRAGKRRVAFQACDDSTGRTGAWDKATCRSNARAYARDPDLVGIVGTYNSGCAAEIIPPLNRARPGPVAMVSPGNTLICLTEASNTCAKGEPGSYYPSGKRNYARVVPNDAFQGAALAQFAKRRGATRPFVLYAKDDPTSLGQATTFRNAARPVGLKIVGFKAWDPKAKEYKRLMKSVRASRPNGVLLAGLTEQNGGRLIRDKVHSLGPNDGAVKLLAPDGFAQQSTIDEAGAAAAGMFASVPGRDPARLSGAGKQLVSKLKGKIGDKPVELYAPYAGEATQVLLDAIEVGAGNRAATASSLFGVDVRRGILGSFSIERSGDPSVGPVTVFRAAKTFEAFAEITPSASLVAAARGK
jgi:branched-chain amino acid transport system substrate-binding protein